LKLTDSRACTGAAEPAMIPNERIAPTTAAFTTYSISVSQHLGDCLIAIEEQVFCAIIASLSQCQA
jgi:hypothetical protein